MYFDWVKLVCEYPDSLFLKYLKLVGKCLNPHYSHCSYALLSILIVIITRSKGDVICTHSLDIIPTYAFTLPLTSLPTLPLVSSIMLQINKNVINSKIVFWSLLSLQKDSDEEPSVILLYCGIIFQSSSMGRTSFFHVRVGLKPVALIKLILKARSQGH